MAQGLPVGRLVNLYSQESGRVSFHGVPASLIGAQAQAIGLPLFQKATDPFHHEAELREAVRSLLPLGVRGIVFGDIYPGDHRDLAERVCADLGLELVEPLWGMTSEDIFRGFVGAGFQALVVSANAHLIDRQWVGRPVDLDFLSYLKGLDNVDVCGENGEYHTFVYNGPLFQRRLELDVGQVHHRAGYYYFLDIRGAQLGEANPLSARE